MRITVDKIASVTRNLDLGKTLTLTDRIEVRAGAVIAGRVLNHKGAYNTLEDRHGRMSTVQSGDIVIGALGHRNALHGYEGVLPAKVSVGDKLQILNLGGVIGHCVSFNPDVGPPFDIEVLGQVLVFPEFNSRVGQPAHIGMNALEGVADAAQIPIIYVAGTCMNSGKTAAACTLVRSLSQAGLRVGGGKLTGVSLQKDILNMRDYGADYAYDFTDTGVVASDASTSQRAARIVFSELAAEGAQIIVAETGDGIMGDYGVQSILADNELMKRAAALVLCANDPVGCWGGVHDLKERYGLQVDVVTGPATDNNVGVRFVQRELGLPALNARTNAQALGDFIKAKLAERGVLK